jgi:hypothetical protein
MSPTVDDLRNCIPVLERMMEARVKDFMELPPQSPANELLIEEIAAITVCDELVRAALESAGAKP